MDASNLVLIGFSVTKDFPATRVIEKKNLVFLKYLCFVFLSAFLSPGKKRGREKDLGREEHYCNFAMHNPL